MAGIYIHIPFCKQACHYCNFYFTTSLAQKDSLIKAIIQEVGLSKEYLGGETIETIYIGGGTPSLLSASEIKSILDAIHHHHSSIALQELTIEVNPDDLTSTKIAELRSLKEYGLNRLSIGVQSFHKADLEYMNRAHTAAQSIAAIKQVQDAGFGLLTIDLIYGTPTMNNEQWHENIVQAFELDIAHISAYALTVEPKTTLAQNIKKHKALPVDEGRSSEQFDILMNAIAKQGYEQYEISNFSKPNQYAVHNTNYWRGRKYQGIGPSAHSYNGSSRSWNVANNMTYIKALERGAAACELEQLTAANQANEYIMTSLRTIWGTHLNHESIVHYQAAILNALTAIDKSFFTLKNNTLKLTQQGKHYADRIASELFIE